MINIEPPKIKLRPEIKKVWRKGLATHKQGKGVLKEDDKYCCLGVFCKAVYGLKIPIGMATSYPYLDKEDARFFNQMEDGYSLEGHLASANDNGATFAEIDQWIETNC